MKMIETENSTGQSAVMSDGWLEIVGPKIDSLRFGVVQITVHESRVVQIEQTEKIRLGSLPAKGSNAAY